MKNFKKRLFNRSIKLNPELVELFISAKFYGDNIVKFDFRILPTGVNKSYNPDALNKKRTRQILKKLLDFLDDDIL